MIIGLPGDCVHIQCTYELVYVHVYCEPCINFCEGKKFDTSPCTAVYVCVGWLVRICAVLSIKAPPIHSHKHYGDGIVLENALGKLARIAAMAIARWRWGRTHMYS